MNSWKNLMRAALGLLFVVAVSASVFAQTGRVNRYTESTFSGTFNSITGSGTAIGASGDDAARAFTVPFSFNYDSVAYTTSNSFSACTNGFFTFSGSTSAPYGNFLGSTTVPNAALGASMDGYVVGNIYYQVKGTAPNRVLVVEWDQFRYLGGSSTTNWQTLIYETSNRIEFIYSAHSFGWSTTAGVGLNGTTSPSFLYLSNPGSSTSSPSTDIRYDPPSNFPPAQLSLLPKSLNYGAVSSGFSLTLYDTAYSLGPNPLTLTSWNITGSTNFTVVSGPAPGTIVPAGQYAVFGIQFSPTSSGNLTGVFTLVTTGKDSGTQQCQLNGTGAAASVAYSFPYNGAYPANSLFHHVARRFGQSAIQYFYVTSTGVAPLNFNSVYFTGLQANMYSIVHLPPSPLASGVTDSIGVRFSPFLEGRPDAQLIVSTNAINIPFDTVSLWGVGVLAHLVITQSRGTGNTLSFDSVAIGDSVCQSLTLHNTGSDTLFLQRQIVTYGDYDFTFYLLTGSDLVLPPDASKIVNVCFKPLARGGRLASVRFYTSIPLTYPDNRDTSQFLINVTGTGVPYGIMSVIGNPSDSALIDSTKCANATIKNMGLSELTVTSATITGAGASDFTISGVTMPFTLAPGASIPVTLCFKAATRGPEAVTLTVNGTTSGRPLTQSIPLLGVGLTACLDAAPSPITFGSTALPGKTIAKTGHDTTCVTVTNCGDVPVTYTAAFTPGTNGGYHVLGSLMTPVVAPNGTTTICIEYDADTIGLAGGSVVVSASEKAAAPKTLALAGVGAGVVIAGSGDGGILGLNYCDTITVTINNTGNVDWTPGSSIGTTGANAGDFTPIGTTNPAIIPAGGSGTIKVIFCPTTNGLAETADLTFPNAAPTPLSGTVTLNGLGSSGVTQQTEKDGFTLGATYPNPTNGKADVIVTLPRASHVTMVLTNLAGAVVRSVYSGTLQNGDNVVSLDASTLPSGTYFYTLTSGDVRLTREMIVGR